MWCLAAFRDETGAPRLASGSWDNSIRLWNPLGDGAALAVLEAAHTDWPTKLVAFPDPSSGAARLASGSKDCTLKVWTGDGALLQTIVFDEAVKDVAVTGDGRGLAATMGTRWGWFQIWR